MTRLRLGVCSLVVALGALAQTAPAWSVTVGQIDDFQDGTTQGWGSGAFNPNPPVNVADVGPAGVGDDSLLITSTGGVGAGSRLIAINGAQWAGDYLTPGVTMIIADVNNVAFTTLDLRIAITGVGGAFASAAAVPLLVGSGWQTVGFPITGADLTSVGGVDVNATLGGVTQLRLLSAATPSFMGDPIAAQLLVDNIVAVTLAPCEDQVDNDGDGLIDLADPGCSGPLDPSENSGDAVCDDGIDNDGDGLVDFQVDGFGDPGCGTVAWPLEDSQCQDGINNDGQIGTDFDGGESILGIGNGDPNGPDPQCAGFFDKRENCGIGFELALAVPLLWAWRSRRVMRQTAK